MLALAAFLIGAAVVLADRPFTHGETGDSSIFDYIAQSIIRGQVPYRDVIDPKGPGSTYLSAAAMAAGRSVGLRDIIAVRWLHVLMMGLLGRDYVSGWASLFSKSIGRGACVPDSFDRRRLFVASHSRDAAEVVDGACSAC